MATYLLNFDSTGRTFKNFQVPTGKRVYLVRAERVSEGTATITDLISLNSYEIPNEQTVFETSIQEEQQVSLAFMGRTNRDILSVNVEVTNPRD